MCVQLLEPIVRSVDRAGSAEDALVLFTGVHRETGIKVNACDKLRLILLCDHVFAQNYRVSIR